MSVYAGVFVVTILWSKMYYSRVSFLGPLLGEFHCYHTQHTHTHMVDRGIHMFGVRLYKVWRFSMDH